MIDPSNLVLAGDGTSVRTGASHYGVKVCNCRETVFLIVIVCAVLPTLRPGGAGIVTGRSILWLYAL